jgi:hypothetical protein
MREVRLALLVLALVVGSLEVLIYVLQLPPDGGASTGAAVSLVEPPRLAPSILVPDPACNSTVDGHYAQIGFLQSVPVESPCD